MTELNNKSTETSQKTARPEISSGNKSKTKALGPSTVALTKKLYTNSHHAIVAPCWSVTIRHKEMLTNIPFTYYKQLCKLR